jgi:hypothetical protein
MCDTVQDSPATYPNVESMSSQFLLTVSQSENPLYIDILIADIIESGRPKPAIYSDTLGCRLLRPLIPHVLLFRFARLIIIYSSTQNQPTNYIIAQQVNQVARSMLPVAAIFLTISTLCTRMSPPDNEASNVFSFDPEPARQLRTNCPTSVHISERSFLFRSNHFFFELVFPRETTRDMACLVVLYRTIKKGRICAPKLGSFCGYVRMFISNE